MPTCFATSSATTSKRRIPRRIVAATFPLHDIVAAQRLFLTKQHVGKIVLTVANY